MKPLMKLQQDEMIPLINLEKGEMKPTNETLVG